MFTMDNFINGFGSFSAHCAITDVVTYGGNHEYRWDYGVTEWNITANLFYRDLILELECTNNSIKITNINTQLFLSFGENQNLESFLNRIEKELEHKYQEYKYGSLI